jgi:hypothetical protein
MRLREFARVSALGCLLMTPLLAGGCCGGQACPETQYGVSMQASQSATKRAAFQEWVNSRWESARQAAPWLASRPPLTTMGAASDPGGYEETALREVLERGGSQVVVQDPAVPPGLAPIGLRADVTQSLALARSARQPRVVLYPTAFDGSPDFLARYQEAPVRHAVHEQIWSSMQSRLAEPGASPAARSLVARMNGTEFFLVLPRP